MNAGTPEEHKLAITEAYVLVGTPRAVQYTLNHGEVSLADQPEYQAITDQLPSADFATFYVRASNFETDLKPALDSVFQSPIVDAISRLVSRVSPLAFTRTTTAPTLLGVALRVDERQLMLDLVANVPFSLQKLNTQPVPAHLLRLIPASATMWAATNLNVAGIAREINIADAVTMITTNGTSGGSNTTGPLGDVVTQTFVNSFGGTVQNLLTYARGQVLVLALPGADGTHSNIALVMPLADKENATALAALNTLKAQLNLISGLSGTLQVETMAGESEIVKVYGKAFEATLPGGFQYTLTNDKLLVIATGDSLPALLTLLKASSAEVQLAPPSTNLPRHVR